MLLRVQVMTRLSAFTCFVFCISGWLLAAEPVRSARRWLPMPELAADPRIPTLKKVAGHEWGQDITSYAEMERYLKALVKAAPDRAVLVPYGKTYEGRTLYYLIIAKPEHVQRRQEIRAANLQLADPRSLPPEKAREVAAQVPALVWLAYGIHGNETSGPEAALLTAYHLLADRRPQTRKLLDDALVLIDPLQNPDGHERFVNVYRETRGAYPDAQPLATEHTERWPSGRFNHYLFDMNRDWFLQSQRESQAKVAAYLQWQPQVYVDAHEMGHNATYFFSPKAEPVNPFYLPQQIESLDQLGQQLARRFDELGFVYTTREMFDGFYPGYGSTWPTFQGGLANLWEQAGVRGLVIRRDDEQTLRFPDAIRHHYVSSLATVEFAAQNSRRLVDEFYEARRRSIQLGHEGPVRDYFLLLGTCPQRAARLAELLRNNGLDVQRVSKSVKADCTEIRTSEKGRREIPSGSFHISVAQPAGRLARVLLDRQVDLEQEFIERQIQRNADRFPDEIYDVTAWSLPLAFGVDCLATVGPVEVASAPWTGAPLAGQVIGGRAKVAYLVPGQDAALPALLSWLRKGLRIHVADRDFRMGDNDCPRGTLILRTSENPDTLHDTMKQAAKDQGLRILASNTGLVSDGAQLGGPHVKWVRPPKVALLVDRPASYAAGHTWYLFDQVWRYPITRVAGSNWGRLDLGAYNVLVLPDGDYGGREGPGEKDAGRLRQWISEGGTLILIKRAALWATQKPVALLSVQAKNKPSVAQAGVKPVADKPPADSPAEPPAQPADPSPGVFLRASVFREHWLTFGCPDTVDVFYQGNVILTPPDAAKGRGLVTLAAPTDVLTSGFCWPETLELVAQTPYLLHESLGAGHVVAFTDDPNYRAMYPVTQRLFLNAVLFGPGH
ncbi:MAG: M14 family metallopeptidase [Pirellulaceae bacterium]|nr:M14 family metallopeptidase [Pirellulaceae bacterium]